MKPFQAILRKESRQQGALAAAMLLFCFLLQLGTVMTQLFTPGMNPDYLAIGLFVTALFAGAAAAISFSAEKDDRTFAFLRSLPVSARTIMAGKTAWIFLGTLVVLAGTSLLAGFWYAVTSWHSGIGAEAAFALFGVGILEALVWGLFWSPRCRTQIGALLATYFCASLCSYAAACFSAIDSGAVVAAYMNAVPLRLGIVAVVAVLAVQGMARWFEFSVQKVEKPSFFEAFPIDLRYLFYALFVGGICILLALFNVSPVWMIVTVVVTVAMQRVFRRSDSERKVASPFFSLLGQSLRQSQTLLLLGLGMLLVLVGTCVHFFRTNTNRYGFDAFELVVPGILFGIFYLIFCGSIFGMDQRNESYRFLSRCGVVPGKVWWSRIVPFFTLTIPLAFFVAVLFGNLSMRSSELGPIEALTPYRLSPWFVLVGMLIPFSVGSFLSISLRSPIVAVTLTGVGSILVYFWMLGGVNGFDFNPLWSTLPICGAFLAASRLRCDDWLRERRTWRSRWKAFAPVVVTFAAICIAIPPIRVYSVPFISMDELENQFVWNSVRKDRDGSTPEKRKAKFDEMRKRLALPPENADQYFSRFDMNGHPSEFFKMTDALHFRRLDGELSVEEYLKSYCKIIETFDDGSETYDFRILKLYEIDRRRCESSPFYFFPWERTRYLRRINTALQFVLQFEDSEDKGWRYSDENGKWHYFAWGNFFASQNCGAFNGFTWLWTHAAPRDFYWRTRNNRLGLLQNALHAWYLEHAETLPERLDELVEAGYLTQIPVDPETGERPEYDFWDAPRIGLGDRSEILNFIGD